VEHGFSANDEFGRNGLVARRCGDFINSRLKQRSKFFGQAADPWSHNLERHPTASAAQHWPKGPTTGAAKLTEMFFHSSATGVAHDKGFTGLTGEQLGSTSSMEQTHHGSRVIGSSERSLCCVDEGLGEESVTSVSGVQINHLN